MAGRLDVGLEGEKEDQIGAKICEVDWSRKSFARDTKIHKTLLRNSFTLKLEVARFQSHG